jgi:hypothetical protein
VIPDLPGDVVEQNTLAELFVKLLELDQLRNCRLLNCAMFTHRAHGRRLRAPAALGRVS